MSKTKQPKLLTEVSKVVTEIEGKPKKVRKKVKTTDDKFSYTVIKESSKQKVEQLIELHKKDKLKARVKYMNNPTGYEFSRTVLFERNANDFEICTFNNKFGISTSNKIYCRETKYDSIIYVKGKFWYRNNRLKSIMPLSHMYLSNFINSVENVNRDNPLVDTFIFKYLHKKFPWILMLKEHERIHYLPYNTVKQNKLFKLNDVYRHIYKVPKNICDVLLTSNFKNNYMNLHGNFNKAWDMVLKQMTNITSLTVEMINNYHFVDTIKMGRTLDRKVNAKWGDKRLTEVHNEWAKEISNIILDCEEERTLKVSQIYLEFAEHMGYKILKTNKDLLFEGMVNHHCVGTYINKVDSGRCGIFHVDGFTLELNISKLVELPEWHDHRKHYKIFNNSPMLYISQFRGKYNLNASEELHKKVIDDLNVFNEMIAKKSIRINETIKENSEFEFNAIF